MANNLYEEAINAADQIKEAAESKVKQQLVEAMSPKIKQLIEKSLLGEEALDEMGDGPPPVESDCGAEGENSYEGDNAEEDDSGKEEREMSDNAEAFYAGSNIQEVEISETSANILKRMISNKSKKQAITEKLSQISEGAKSLKKAILIAESSNKTRKFSKKFKRAYKNLLSELKNIESNSIIKSDKTLLKEYLKISKELKNMSRRRQSRKNYLNESLEDLLEMNIFEDDDDDDQEDKDDLDAEEEDEELGDEELGDEELGDEELGDEELGDEDDLDLGPDMSDDVDMEGGDINWSGDDETLGGLVRAALTGEGEDLEGEDLEGEELDVTEESDVLEFDENANMDEMHETRRRKKDLFLEIDENMLKKEIKKMRRLREGEASEMASHFGGGSLDKEMFVDVDEGDLNVHAGELGREDVPTPKVEAALRKTMRKNRMLESKIRQFKNAVRGMKTQLSEMNLFNAKLLYANKLMQNRDLSIKQQRHIVESLDEAGTLNEAKLLFESLSKSLSKPARRGKNLSEGANRRTLSSASRSTKSAQPINENVALDRWATLAGIKK